MNRDERQDLAIERWKKASGRATWVLPTGFGIYKPVAGFIE